MFEAPRIHLTGASGAGVTTLGAALATRLGGVHLDTDDFYWLTTTPYREKRAADERLRLLGEAFAAAPQPGDEGASTEDEGKRGASAP